MIFKGPKSAVSNQRGFTLVELMMVVAIIGILAAISIQQFTKNRAKAFDTQVVALVKNLLTAVAIDEPTGDSAGPVFGGTLALLGLPQVEVPAGVTWYIVNVDAAGTNRHDMWMFYLAHPSGERGYYFWIPGNACGAIDDSIAGDGTGNSSDRIFYDTAPPDGTPYRIAAGV
jgi:prepilin-type N-terminal cleavage/methylation domain-containing protein